MCFLWHQHQPDYTDDGGFFLPWVRLHAAKDYLDLLDIISDYRLKHTINVVPSLLYQLDEYGRGRKDPVQLLCEIGPSELTHEQKAELAQWAATVQRQTMVEPLPRYNELFDDLTNNAWNDFTDQDWLDVMVLLQLAWVGPVSRRRPAVAALIDKERDYTSEDLTAVMNQHLHSMTQVQSKLTQMSGEGLIEVSVSPYYHPILPLICDTDSAREARRDIQVPNPPFRNVNDAHWHVASAIEDWYQRSGTRPTGMWPAEGSISMQALDVMRQHGVVWTASDETVLRNSLGTAWQSTAAYFVYNVPTASGSIAVLFRDHNLSDAIGFEYATWKATDAVENFVSRLEQIRNRIVHNKGEQALLSAVVPIILDGENCWEFYEGNGELFLRTLFSRLTDDDKYETLTCAEAVNTGAATPETASPTRNKLHHVLKSVCAGSWINGTFDVWIGSPVKNRAWSLLNEVRALADWHLAPGTGHSASETWHSELGTWHCLEASDWFWWYDEKHIAPHKHLFDEMFRKKLKELFDKMNIIPSINLDIPLQETVEHETSNAKRFDVVFGHASMHDANALTSHISLETQENWQRVKVHLLRLPTNGEEVVLSLKDRYNLERSIMITSDQVLVRSGLRDEGYERKSPLEISIYLHSAAHWSAVITEQRIGGRRAEAEMELSL